MTGAVARSPATGWKSKTKPIKCNVKRMLTQRNEPPDPLQKNRSEKRDSRPLGAVQKRGWNVVTLGSLSASAGLAALILKAVHFGFSLPG